MKFIRTTFGHGIRSISSATASYAGCHTQKMTRIPGRAAAPIRRGFGTDAAARGASPKGDRPSTFKIVTQDDFVLAKQVLIVAGIGGGTIKLLVDDSLEKRANHRKDAIDYAGQAVKERIAQFWKGMKDVIDHASKK